MSSDETAADTYLSRRTVLLGAAAVMVPPAILAMPAAAIARGSVDGPDFIQPSLRRAQMAIACFIRYQIDPLQRDAFRLYAENWGRIIPRCGGHLIGYFLPHEGTNDVAWGLIAFDSLASYEAYRARLKNDAQGRENFAMAQSKRFILREERNFVEIVEGTFGIAALVAATR